MKRIIILCLFLTGCSEHYEIVKNDDYESCNSRTKQTFYSCNYTGRFSLMSYNLKMCDTKEECNEYCDKLRNK